MNIYTYISRGGFVVIRTVLFTCGGLVVILAAKLGRKNRDVYRIISRDVIIEVLDKYEKTSNTCSVYDFQDRSLV